MEWHVALFWEDCRYFCVSYQNNLMKGESFLCSVFKIIDSKSLLKSALTGKDAFDISSWSCLLKKFVVDKAFLSYVLEFLQISFGLSIKGTWNWMVESDLMTWSRGILRKIKFFVLNEKSVFCLLTLNSREVIITKYNFNQVRWLLF